MLVSMFKIPIRNVEMRVGQVHKERSNLNIPEKAAKSLIFPLQSIQFILHLVTAGLRIYELRCSIWIPALIDKGLNHPLLVLFDLGHAAIVVTDQADVSDTGRKNVCQAEL